MEKILLDEFAKIEKHIDKKYKSDKDLKELVSRFKSLLSSTLQLNDAKPDIDDQTNKGSKKDTPGALYNRNSVCYMNALIQALASSKIVIKRFQELSNCYPSNSSLSLLLVLLNDVNENKISVTENSEFLKHLVNYVNWTKSSQQDAFDLLATFISHIEKEFPIEKENCDLPLKVKILHEFQGNESSNRIQTYLGLSLNLCGGYEKSGVRLDYMINQHFQYSEIDNNPDKLTRMSLFQKAPDVLLIHIQANKLDPKTSKLYKPKYTIIYEEDMTLYFHIVSSIKGGDSDFKADRPFNIEVKYHLKAVIEHMGQISCGHFVTYRKWNDKWYLMNDAQAKSIEFKVNICPYIMIYEKYSELKGINQTPNDSEDTNQTLNTPVDINQTSNDSEDTNQTLNNSVGINQTSNDSEDINQTLNNSVGINQTPNDSEDANQASNDSKVINQTTSDSTNINQTPSNSENINQTLNNPIGINQTPNDSEDTNQASNDSKVINQTPCDPTSINQTHVDPKGTDQTERDKNDCK